LFFRRFEIVKEIWKIKKQDWIAPLDNSRWQELMQDNLEVSREFWFKDDFINDIWNRIHKKSLDLEK
jgi:chorismate mutase